MLQMHLAESLHTQRHHAFVAEAARHRLAVHAASHAASHASNQAQARPPVLRARVGWWMVAAGLRLALWRRSPPGRSAAVRTTAAS